MDINKIISKRALSIDGSAIRKASEQASLIKDSINLTIGQPDFDVDQKIKERLIYAMNNKKNGYVKTIGIEELRDEIKRKHHVSTKNDILVTCGVTAGVFLSLAACLDVDDELLIPDPYFLQYAEVVKILGIKPIFINTYSTFQLTLDMIKARITEKTKAILINSPCNPTGVVVPQQNLKEIIEFLDPLNIMIIYDEIYVDFNYSNIPNSNPFDFGENVILLNGYSKSYAMTGWRLGYVIAPEKLIERMTRIQGQTYVSPTSVVQYAALAAKDVNISSIVKAYKDRHELVFKELNGRYLLSNSDGGFYYFIEVPKNIAENATQFCEIAAQYGVALVPGKAFSQRDTHFRLSFCVGYEKLKKGLDILKDIYDEYTK